MLPIPLVTGWNLLPFVRFLRGIGAPVERWLAESRIPERAVERPDTAFPLYLGLDFVERAARAEGAESLGLDVGRHESADSLGPFGRLLSRSPTLYRKPRPNMAITKRTPLSAIRTNSWWEAPGVIMVFAAISWSTMPTI